MSQVQVSAWRCDRVECGHVWLGKAGEVPKWCARCKRPGWNLVPHVKGERVGNGRERGKAIAKREAVRSSKGKGRKGDDKAVAVRAVDESMGGVPVVGLDPNGKCPHNPRITVGSCEKIWGGVKCRTKR